IYALALSDAAATTRAGSQTGATAASPEGAAAAVTALAGASEEAGAAQPSPQPTPARSRTDLTNGRSAVFHVLPAGGTDVVWSSTSVTGFGITAARGGVLIGTSDKGRIYLVTDDGRDTLLVQSTEGQISSLIARGTDVYAASSNQGKLFRFGQSLVKE